MLHYCCTGGCFNSSEINKDLSFHCLTFCDKQLSRVWTTRIKRDPKFFSITKHKKICSEHFIPNDFVEPDAKKRMLKKDAVPSVFHWTREESKHEETKEVILRPSYSVRSGELDRTVVIGKLDKSRLGIDEATDSVSEGEDQVVGRPELVSRRTETSWGDLHATRHDGNGKEHFGLPCMHEVSIHHLLSKCTTIRKRAEIFFTFLWP